MSKRKLTSQTVTSVEVFYCVETDEIFTARLSWLSRRSGISRLECAEYENFPGTHMYLGQLEVVWMDRKFSDGLHQYGEVVADVWTAYQHNGTGKPYKSLPTITRILKHDRIIKSTGQNK